MTNALFEGFGVKYSIFPADIGLYINGLYISAVSLAEKGCIEGVRFQA